MGCAQGRWVIPRFSKNVKCHKTHLELSVLSGLPGDCVFIDPELARVGLTESQAREKGLAYRVASVPFDSAWRAWTISERGGFMKTLVDSHSDRILGFTAFGAEAGELMGTVQLAMLAGLPYTTLRDAMFAHPTMTEGLKALFVSVPRMVDHAEQP
jgi:pyruvate/2-oxoglutarate dehydrogenase complex dihydrolipoamide dehydrogenase (E3) component